MHRQNGTQHWILSLGRRHRPHGGTPRTRVGQCASLSGEGNLLSRVGLRRDQERRETAAGHLLQRRPGKGT